MPYRTSAQPVNVTVELTPSETAEAVRRYAVNVKKVSIPETMRASTVWSTGNGAVSVQFDDPDRPANDEENGR